MIGTRTDAMDARIERGAAETAHRAGPARFRRILVATAGEPNAEGALRVAAELAKRYGAEVGVVSVFQPPIPYPVARGERPHLEPAHQEAVGARMSQVHRQLAGLGDREVAWPVACEIGQSGRCIVEEAQRRRADLLVVGLGRPRPQERVLGDRALLDVAHHVDRPLLAVRAGDRSLPRTIVVGVGRNGELTRLVHVAAAIAAEGAKVHLLHVCEAGESPGDTHDRGRLLDHVEAELRALGVATTRMELDGGDATSRLVAYARDVGAELIAGGLHGAGFAARSVVRNTAMHLAAEAPCSVLLVPRAEP